jgi:hypothetical protein
MDTVSGFFDSITTTATDSFSKLKNKLSPPSSLPTVSATLQPLPTNGGSRRKKRGKKVRFSKKNKVYTHKNKKNKNRKIKKTNKKD